MRTWICLFVLLCLVVPAAAVQPASVVNVYHIRNGEVTLVSSEIVYGKAPNYFTDNGDFLIAASTSSDTHQKEAWIDDPRVNRIIRVTDGEPSAVVRDDVDFSVTLPLRDDTAKVSVYDRNRTLLLVTDLGRARAAFCSAHADDERCRGQSALGMIGLFAAAAVIGAGAYLVLKRKKEGGS